MKFTPAVLGLSLLCSCTFTHTYQLRDTQPSIPAITLDQLEVRADVPDAQGKLGCSDLLFRKQSIEHFKNGDFEIHPVISSKEAAARITPRL